MLLEIEYLGILGGLNGSFYCKRSQELVLLGEIRYVDKCVDNFLGRGEGGRKRLGV